MNFQDKVLSINDYMDKLYSKLIKDSQMMNDWETLFKALSLEPRRLTVYAAAIKEELKTELYGQTDYKYVSDMGKRKMLDEIDDIHNRLVIPEFRVSKDDITEKEPVNAAVVRTAPASTGKSSQLNLRVGVSMGAITGAGLGLVISKSVPALLIGCIGGAIAGGVIASATGILRTKKMNSSVSKGMSKTQESIEIQDQLSHHKAKTVIMDRKAVIEKVFLLYIKQLEEVCRTSVQ